METSFQELFPLSWLMVGGTNAMGSEEALRDDLSRDLMFAHKMPLCLLLASSPFIAIVSVCVEGGWLGRGLPARARALGNKKHTQGRLGVWERMCKVVGEEEKSGVLEQ